MIYALRISSYRMGMFGTTSLVIIQINDVNKNDSLIMNKNKLLITLDFGLIKI